MNKKALLITFFVATVAIVGFHLLFLSEIVSLFHNPLFALVDVGLVVAYAWFTSKSIKNAEDPNKETLFKIAIVIAAAAMLWAGGWAAQYRADKADNIAPTYKEVK